MEEGCSQEEEEDILLDIITGILSKCHLATTQLCAALRESGITTLGELTNLLDAEILEFRDVLKNEKDKYHFDRHFLPLIYNLKHPVAFDNDTGDRFSQSCYSSLSISELEFNVDHNLTKTHQTNNDDFDDAIMDISQEHSQQDKKRRKLHHINENLCNDHH